MLGYDTENGRYSVRMNFWLPLQEQPNFLTPSERFFSYNYPHDHNFSFLTVGAYGPGYDTLIAEYDKSNTVGYHNESVELNNLRRETLTPGKVMFYEGSKDIHTQLPPNKFSVSINLLLHKIADRETPQFKFDIEQGKIVKEENIPGMSWPMVRKLINFIPPQNLEKFLLKTLTENKNYKVRGEAMKMYLERGFCSHFIDGEINKPNNAYARYLLDT